MAGPPLRFFGLLGGALLALCAGYAALVLCSTPWAAARQLDAIFPFYPWRTRPFSAATYEGVRVGLGLAAGLLAALTGTGAATAGGRREIAALGRETGRAGAALWRGLGRPPAEQRRLAGALFAALTALRLYFSLANPGYDDAVSYELFVSKGWLATSAYYPLPNNHVLSNTLSLGFYQLNPGFWWTMRLPVLLTSTGATLFLFAALRRRANFRVAAVAVALFSGLQLSLYHAGVGRGYWLLIGLAGAVFFSTLALVRTRGQSRAAWAGLAVGGVLGGFTVPTFVYVLAAAFSWLGLAWLRPRRWPQLARLGAAAALTGAAAAALYAPLLLVSGFDKFAGNGFVAALAPAAFWRGLPAYVWHTEGFLAGQRTLGAPLVTGPVLALVAGLYGLARTGRLPAGQARRLRQLGGPALWFGAVPYALVVGQRVFPPERVLLYKAFFFFVLTGLVVDWALARWPAHRGLRRALAALALLFAAYETYAVVRVNPAARGSNAAYHAGMAWLAGQPPGPVLAPEPTHNLFFRFYAHSEMRQRAWQIDDDQRGRTRYAYVVAYPNKRGFFQPLFPFPPAYHNAELDIYAVPPGYPLITKPWRH